VAVLVARGQKPSVELVRSFLKGADSRRPAATIMVAFATIAASKEFG
jgi:hypothetical protein